MRLAQIWRFPVKSLRGQRLSRAHLGPRGVFGDREWMLVDSGGRFLTQRQLPRMALVDVQFDGDGLQLSAPEMGSLLVPTPHAGAELDVRVWEDPCRARDGGDAAASWLSGFLGRPCRLVWMPPEVERQVDIAYARPGDRVGFADGFPLLLISQASLDDLNGRLLERGAHEPMGMVRFRPNLVVGGAEPFAEDGWRRLRIGEIEFELVKPCSRCIIPTIDPVTAERSAEPLAVLRSYRQRDHKVYFGQNAIHRGSGELAEGMAVEVIR